MIKLQDYTPEVYYKQSRDFQFIGRLYDVVLNAVKTNADMIYDIPSSDAAGSDLIDLLVLTLGFKHQHNYNVNQLSAICSIFPTILRNKGSLAAIRLTCQTLLNAEGIDETVQVECKDAIVYIYISPKLLDLSLLRDILSYILPAGLSCQIIKATWSNPNTATTEISSDHNVYIWKTGGRLDELTSVIVKEITDADKFGGKHAGADLPGIISNIVALGKDND